ncbi:xylulokinase [Micropruina sonneratiae]|uniref:xylulokinase n=1 Tax=Micropruina sonneratiae TaxID=2986940 RepID=UPI002225D5E2|nr:FGGY family carbohydrate kinase [Micropruina sp. KQZ13P-5]MCW3157839.1 FGGY family carbohydrate kinase [Micropruina sp. KQZ13P-5]
MSSPLVIGIDSSTTSTKALVVDDQGTVLAEGKAEFAMQTPRVDFYEQDAHDWWRSTDTAVGEAVGKLEPGDRARISHLCATIQRQTFTLVDEQGEPLRPGILWLDGRAAEQVRRIGSEHIHQLTGFQPDVTPSVYKIAWLADHEPELVTSAHKLVGVHAYLVHAMTGRFVDSAATADSLGLFDMAHLDWSDEMITHAGLRREQLCELVPAASVIGPIDSAITSAWGIDQEVQLVASCGDGQAAALGVGAIGLDEAYLNMGTALVAGVHSPDYEHAPVFRTDAAGIPGQYVLEIVQNSGAYLAGWFRDKLGDPNLGGRPDPALDEAAASVAAGCGGLVTLPYWNAVQSPFWNPVAHGAIVGLAGAYGRPELYRSTLEGLSIEMARNLAGLATTTGVPLRTVTAVGGGQRSPLWRRIMTDAIGLPLTESPTEEVSAMGAAVMAMAAAGRYDSVQDAATAMAKHGATTEPDPDNHELYRELGEIQAATYHRLADIFDAQYAFAATHPLHP